MNSNVNDPAFPLPLAIGNDGIELSGEPGLSKYEYFAAHAPAEPQPWFEPAMAMLRPKHPSPSDPRYSLSDRSTDDVNLLKLADDWTRDPIYDLCEVNDDPGLAAFERDYVAASKAQCDYDRDYKMQRYIQWPWAWAVAVIGGGM